MGMMSDEARKKLIESARADHSPGDETLRLPWKDSAEIFPVVQLSVDAVLLNPRSHRIRAQLESHENRRAVAEAPFSEEAQELISNLLRDEEGYEDLKTNISVGQREAGVITREGLLVNANRRVVALRDLRKRYVRVAVLPPSATQEEIDQLELRLQVARDYRIDYTFTNQLLFVDELLTKYNRSPEETALQLNWASSNDPKEVRKGRARVEQATRLLRLIREIQHLSGRTIPLIFFDDKSVALDEIDKQFENTQQIDRRAALAVRSTRILGLLADVQYRSLRQIDENFLTDYLIPALEDSDIFKSHAASFFEPSTQPTENEIVGLDILEEATVDAGEPTPAKILEVLAKSAKDTKITLIFPDTTATEVDRDQLVDELRLAVEQAAGEKKRDERTADKLAAPIENLAEADRLLKRALEGYKSVRRDSEFNTGKFSYLVKRIKKSFEALRSLTGEQ